jgi:hypothetical protein
MKSGNLNLLETSGPHRASYGTRLPLYLLHTYSTEQCVSGEADSFSASQEIPRILWKPKVNYRFYKISPINCPILHQLLN